MTVIEPFCAMNLPKCAGTSTSMSQLSARFFHCVMRPVASTCPVTKCPPNLSASVSDFSRLTSAPTLKPAMMLSECAVTSDRSTPAPFSTMVRQQPECAIESPMLTSSSGQSPHAIVMRCPSPMGSCAVIRPRPVMMPVNIFASLICLFRPHHHAHIVADTGHVMEIKLHRICELSGLVEREHFSRVPPE